ncbi:MAG: TetR/AcrR family transcriptional regulator [Defluviitaleaceae bacterium]|nr:TetR/AcrR family transcriptional regulator [Defluviitaleaceae bacterium]
MSTKKYHHGDLRMAMIEKGIEMINEDGVNTLSLRKLAVACGVSHAAPYSHFANRDELFEAIKDYISDQFDEVLEAAIKKAGVSIEGLYHLGCAFVLFFTRNPQYFSFIFSRTNVRFDLAEMSSEYKPFMLYKKFMTQLFDELDYPEERRLKTYIVHWAMVHGLASVATISGGGEEWEEIIPDMLSQFYFIHSWEGLGAKQLK